MVRPSPFEDAVFGQGRLVHLVTATSLAVQEGGQGVMTRQTATAQSQGPVDVVPCFAWTRRHGAAVDVRVAPVTLLVRVGPCQNAPLPSAFMECKSVLDKGAAVAYLGWWRRTGGNDDDREGVAGILATYCDLEGLCECRL